MAETSLTLATYNIHIGVPMGKQIGEDVSTTDELDAIASVIRQCNADIVALQEVDCEYGISQAQRRRSSILNQARYLAATAAYSYIFGSAQDDTGYPTDNPAYVEWGSVDRWTNNGGPHGEVGNALLYRGALAAPPENIPLPKDKGQERRACIRTEIELLPSDSTTSVSVVLYATHLQHNNGETRYKQMAAILDRANAEPQGTLVFILGDLNHELNDTETTNPIRLALDKGFHDLAAPAPGEDATRYATYPADCPDIRIDFILANQPLQVTDKRVLKSLASDHLPVAVTVKLPE